jgi:EAL domain-containing protein (putative c-di-GMP-specific phosphodiesterase class I)
MCNKNFNIKNELNKVIENDELFLCYQPLINAKTNRMEGMEALVRWRHPQKGIISPMDFIPIAEETKHIIAIGEWVLRKACVQMRKWLDLGYKKYGISVNISAIQLRQADFSEVVTSILNEAGLHPEYLILEITETVCMESSNMVTRNLMRLKQKGVMISIDDFGTGYNTLNYLQTIEISHLKIDKTFVNNYESNVNQAIIEMIIGLGHRINAKIIAEGVETKEQYDYLKKMECDTIQGYFFSEPLLAEEMMEFLKKDEKVIEKGIEKGMEKRSEKDNKVIRYPSRLMVLQ